MENAIYTSQYMQCKRETREAICAIFGVKRTGRTETVVDARGVGKCVSDGATNKDLEVITFDKLLTYLGEADENDNIVTLFTKAVNKIESPMFVMPMPTAEEVPVIEKIVEENKPTFEEEEVIDLYKVENFKVKCEKCAFETASKIAMKMHFGRFHKDFKGK